MQILHVTPYFAPSWAYGGPPRSIFELCRELVRRGQDVTVLTTDAYDERRRARPGQETLDGIVVVRLPNFSNNLAWHRQLFLPKGTARFLRDRVHNFDIIHLHMYRTLQGLTVRREALRAGIPYVFSARGSLPVIVRRHATKAFFDAMFGSRVLRDAAELVALSGAERKQYEAMGVPSSKVTIVFNGIDSESFSRPRPRRLFAKRHGLDGKRVVTYLGRLDARKGLEHLLRAFREVKASAQDTVLVLAGPDAGSRPRLEKLARLLSISSSVVFPGFVTGAEKLQVYDDSDVIVYPGFHEVFGLVPFEALACGKPIVVSDDSGCGEIVRDARAGFTVPFGDESRWSRAIIAALDGGQQVEEMIRRGQSFVREKLSWQASAAATELVYGKALAGSDYHYGRGRYPGSSVRLLPSPPLADTRR